MVHQYRPCVILRLALFEGLRSPFKIFCFWVLLFLRDTSAAPTAKYRDGIISTNHIRDNIYTETLTASPSGRIAGWVSPPNLRGTSDILWTCCITSFICSYTILCLNVPSRNDNWRTIAGRRLKWMCLAMVGPEFVLTYAAGQWSRARQSVEAFHSAGYTTWTMRQAFFADMGGFVFHAPGSDSFPLNAKQLHWLVANNHVKYPEVTAAEMWDKSKQDKLAKVITFFQIGYLVLQCICRAAQRLAITTLELNTVAVVVCSLMTSFSWLHKPLDVRTPIRIHAAASIQEITAMRPWKQTPLDFVDENGPGWSVNIQPFMKLPVIPPERPIQRIPNDRFPMNPYGAQEYYLCLATLLFTAIHVCGWNFAFPSKVEQIFWRVASTLLFGTTATFWLLETMASWKRLGRLQRLYFRLLDRKGVEEFEKARLGNTQTRESTVLPLPWEFWSIFPFVVLYGIARIYLLVEAFLELRTLEATAFIDVEWSIYLPHL